MIGRMTKAKPYKTLKTYLNALIVEQLPHWRWNKTKLDAAFPLAVKPAWSCVAKAPLLFGTDLRKQRCLCNEIFSRPQGTHWRLTTCTDEFRLIGTATVPIGMLQFDITYFKLPKHERLILMITIKEKQS